MKALWNKGFVGSKSKLFEDIESIELQVKIVV
jgi:hypothetical protein